jgi:hypothetical protein
MRPTDFGFETVHALAAGVCKVGTAHSTVSGSTCPKSMIFKLPAVTLHVHWQWRGISDAGVAFQIASKPHQQRVGKATAVRRRSCVLLGVKCLGHNVAVTVYR